MNPNENLSSNQTFFSLLRKGGSIESTLSCSTADTLTPPTTAKSTLFDDFFLKNEKIFDFSRQSKISKIYFKLTYDSLKQFKRNFNKVKPVEEVHLNPFHNSNCKGNFNNFAFDLKKKLLIIGLDETIVHRELTDPKSCKYTLNLNYENYERSSSQNSLVDGQKLKQVKIFLKIRSVFIFGLT